MYTDLVHVENILSIVPPFAIVPCFLISGVAAKGVQKTTAKRQDQLGFLQIAGLSKTVLTSKSRTSLASKNVKAAKTGVGLMLCAHPGVPWPAGLSKINVEQKAV
jgi:hypothetical protein